MDLSTLLPLSFALSADAFAVALASSFSIKYMRLNKALKVALFFGGFQGMMPLLGGLLGVGLRGGADRWALLLVVNRWLAFGILCAIGGKMLRDVLGGEEEPKGCNPGDTAALGLMAIATSLDALAAGVGLAATGQGLAAAATVIAAVTFGVCLMAMLVGRRIGCQWVRPATIAGGVILVAIGFKILLDPMAAS
ncbi:MAG: manganese efflux pump MntP family protein [Cyanophyceae cyanobacterium]